MFATYLRLRCHISESNLSVIRKARRKIHPGNLYARDLRKVRKAIYREMIQCHLRARRMADEFRI